MLTLRTDQTDLVSEAGMALKEHQSVLMQAPTGFGKTIVFSRIALGAEKKRKRVILGIHRRELAYQTARTFDRFGIRYGFIAAGMQTDPFAYVHIASAGTLVNRPKQKKCDLLLPDEAHLWASDARAELITDIRQDGAMILGATATPERLDGRSMRPLFNHMIHGPSVAWLMEQGHLSRYRLFTPVRPDFRALHTRDGEYIVSELEEAFDKPSIIGDAIKVYRKYALGKRTLAFSFSRKHGKHLTEMYNLNGIPAAYVDGDSTPEDRKRAAEMLAKGEINILVSVDLLIEGYDLASQVGYEVPIEAISLQRPTQSLPRALQMIGRALRKKDEPAIIMDHVSLIAQHGLPDEERAWSLDGREARQNAESEKAIPTFRCTACFYTQRSPFRKCPDCQALVPISEGRKVEVEEGDLAEVDLEAVRRAKKVEVQRARDLPSLAKVAVSQGHKPGWIIHIMKARGQHVEWAAVERAMGEARI